MSKSKSKSNSGRYYASFWCAVLISCLWWLRRPSFDEVAAAAGTNNNKNKKNEALPLKDNAVVLVPGELPGYTGWARLEQTLAGSFQIASRQHKTTVVAGNEWNVTVQCVKCRHTIKRSQHAQFYARAYGPAVLAGNIHEINRTAYTISFLPMDPGSYHVEVVLIASVMPSWNVFPLNIEQEEPTYEGFLLPDFPLQLQVLPSSSFMSHTSLNQSCTMSNLLSTTPTSAYHAARWVVVDKVSHPNHVVSAQASRSNVTFEEYTSGHQSLGIFMDYQHHDCLLDAFPHASKKLTKYAKAHSNMHIILVGDSTMRLQSILFQSIFPNIKMTWVSTSGGMLEKMENVTSTLQSLVQDDKKERRFVLFNTGLHDVDQLCHFARVMQEERRKRSGIDSNFSCTARYRTLLYELVDFIHHYPAELKVFMSTTAGWLRYGVFEVEWPPDMEQSAVLSSNLVAHFNEIAYQVLKNFEDIGVLDAYWLSLARPDNREIGLVGNLPKHLVHPGREVLTAMVNNWIHVLLLHFSTTHK